MNLISFNKLLSTRFYPLLRAEGFRGSGTTLRRINLPVVQVFNVQGSAGTDRCYINLGVHLSFLPSAGQILTEPNKVKEYDCEFRERLQSPPAYQHGWQYGHHELEAELIIKQMIEEWKKQAQPFFAKYQNFPTSFVALLSSTDSTTLHPGHALTLARIALQLGRVDKAQEMAAEALSRVNPPATSLRDDIEQFLTTINTNQ